MYRPLLATAALTLVAATAPAQTTVVFPTNHTTLEGSAVSSSGFPFAFGVSRSQAIFSRQFLNIPNGASIRRVGVRPDAAANATGHRIRLEIAMGHTNTAVLNASYLFANNYTGAATTVYTPKLVQLPNLTPTNPGPSTNYVWIDLDTPFVYDATKNLVVDFKVSGNDFGNQAFSYPLDMSTWLAARTTYGTACRHSTGQTPALNTTGGYIYGSWQIALTNSTVTTPYALHIGTGASSWAGLPLPFPMDNLGAPGCSLLVDFPVTLIGSTSFSGTASIYLTVPNNLEFYGLTFHAQMLLLDFFANNLGIVTTNAVSTTFGAPPQMTHVTATGSATGTSGSPYIYDGTVCVFQYQ